MVTSASALLRQEPFAFPEGAVVGSVPRSERPRAAGARPQAVLGAEARASRLPWHCSLETFALRQEPGVARAGCGLCRRRLRSAPPKSRRPSAPRGGARRAAGWRCATGLPSPSPAGSPGLSLRARRPFPLTPAPLRPPRGAALSRGRCAVSCAGAGAGGVLRCAALREDANRRHRLLLCSAGSAGVRDAAAV